MTVEIIRALLGLTILVILARIARALWLGRVKWGGEIHARDREPRRYWIELALEAFPIPLLGLAIFWAPSVTSWPILLAIILPASVRFLITRRKGSRDRIFAQGPGEYLALALLYGLVVLAAIGLMLFFLRGL